MVIDYMSRSKLTLVELPERSPECKSNDYDTPLLAPTLCRSMNVPILEDDSIDSMIEYFEKLDYVNDVTYNAFTIFVLCNLEEYSTPKNCFEPEGISLQENDLVTTTNFFREGVHLLSNKIWRVRRTLESTTELQCKREMGYPVSYCNLAADLCKGTNGFYVFMVDLHYEH